MTLNRNAAAAQAELLNPALAVPDAVPVQVSYGVVEFGTAEELLDAVKRADLDMFTRKRGRATQT